MLNLSNVLSLSRAGFALVFLQHNPWIRFCAISFAMITDFLDGYIARRQHTTSQFGAILDPVMDKFFIFFTGGIFFLEKKLPLLGLFALLSRDISICLFGLFLCIVHGWKNYEVKAIVWGKIITVSQFLLIIGLTFDLSFSTFVYLAFVIMACFAFFELIFRFYRQKK